MARGLVALLAMTAVCVAAPSPAAARDRDAPVITYTVGVRDVSSKRLPALRAIVAATLNDPRGWSLGGRVRFREVRAGGRLPILLAAPHVVVRHAGCSAAYSCAPGGVVLINHDRWTGATASYPGRAWLHAYRQMVVNHEVGHALGFGHVWCPRRGAPAPVMQQQSKGLGGCARNAWPLAGERAALAARLGVRAARPPAPFAAGRRAAYVALGMRRAAVSALLGAPRRANGGVADYARPPVRVRFSRGAVVVVRSRSAADVDGRGAGIGARVRALRHAHPVACEAQRCVLRRGARQTTFALRDGRVTSVTVAPIRARPARRTLARCPTAAAFARGVPSSFLSALPRTPPRPAPAR